MPTYKFYRINADGSVIGTADYHCDNDTAAVAHAMEVGGRCAIEIWRDDTKLAHIEGGIFAMDHIKENTGIPDCDPEANP